MVILAFNNDKEINSMKTIEVHFLAAYLASSAACDVIELLPDCDLIVDLEEILQSQLDIFNHMIEEKHYGTNNLTQFISYTQDMKKQVLRLKGGYD